jgi:hypothetical protein
MQTDEIRLQRYIKKIIRENSVLLNRYRGIYPRYNLVVSRLKRVLGKELKDYSRLEVEALIWKCLYELKDEHHSVEGVEKKKRAEESSFFTSHKRHPRRITLEKD